MITLVVSHIKFETIKTKHRQRAIRQNLPVWGRDSKTNTWEYIGEAKVRKVTYG